MVNKKTIIVFAKAPVAGEVKTRLTPFLTEEDAAILHRNLVSHTVETVSSLEHCSIELWVGKQHQWLTELAGEWGLPIFEQCGDDLGERMAFAIGAALTRSEQVLIIGTDCPGITGDYLQRAFDGLELESVVVGPADDGGYVLLGLTKIIPGLFGHMRWGSSEVFKTTISRLQQHAVGWIELESLMDIDRPEDFNQLEQLRPDLTSGLSRS